MLYSQNISVSRDIYPTNYPGVPINVYLGKWDPNDLKIGPLKKLRETYISKKHNDFNFMKKNNNPSTKRRLE